MPSQDLDSNASLHATFDCSFRSHSELVSHRVMSTTVNGSAKTTSTMFAPRPSTNVPSATQAFEPLAKSVLSHRLLYNIFAYSAAFSLASTVFLAGGDDASFLLRLFQPSTWLNASLTWLIGVLPIIVARKVFLTRTWVIDMVDRIR